MTTDRGMVRLTEVIRAGAVVPVLTITRQPGESVPVFQQRRIEIAKKVAEQQGVTVTEALKQVGAPIPEYKARIARETREAEEAKARVRPVEGITYTTPEAENKVVVYRNGNLVGRFDSKKLPGYIKDALGTGAYTYKMGVRTWDNKIALLTPRHLAERVALSPSKQPEYDIKIGLSPGLYDIQLPSAKFRKTHTMLRDGTWFKNKDLVLIKKETPDLYKILVKDGYEAYRKAIQVGYLARGKAFIARAKARVEELAIATGFPQRVGETYNQYMSRFRKAHIEIPPGSGEWIAKADFNKMPEYLKVIARNKGFPGLHSYSEQIDAAFKTLAPFREGEGYDIVKILINKDENPEAYKAARLVYREQPEVFRDAWRYIQENYMPQWRGQDFWGVPLDISELWRKATPWKEKEGETASTAMAKVIEKWEYKQETGDPADDRRMYFDIDLPPFYKGRVDISAIVEPGDKAFASAASWITDTFLPGVAGYSAWVGQEVSRGGALTREETMLTGAQLKEIHKDRKDAPLAPIPAVAISQALADLIVTIPATIAGVGTAALLQAKPGEEGEALLGPALLLAGMASWMVGRPLAFSRDPLYEIPYTVVLFRGMPAPYLLRLAKRAKIAVDPRMITNTNLALQADIARVKIPKGMDAFSAREMIQAVEFAWGGKALVPVGMKRLKPRERVHLTAAIKGDVVFKDAAGKVRGNVSPFQMTTESTAFHATGDLKPILTALGKKGYFTVKPAGTGYGGFWMSQQLAQTFLSRGKLDQVGGLMVRFTVKDLKELPLAVLREPNFAKKKVIMEQLAREGRLPPGIYPVFKHYGKPPKFELELFASPGTKFYSTPSKWYAPTKQGTATMSTTSMIGFKKGTITKAHLDSVAQSIAKLKKEKPETVGKKGQILYQRKPVPHPTKPGMMNSRVTGVVIHPKTKAILMVMDRAEAAYGLVGGKIDLTWKHERPPQGHTWESGLSNQAMSEVNFGTRNPKYVGMYLGKVNEYALSGSRVYEATARGARIDPVGANRRLIKEGVYPEGKSVEIQKAFWWDGKSPVTVYPAVFDILKAVAVKYGLDMSKVRIYRQSPSVLFRTRDMAFATRVASGKLVNPLDIKAMNIISIRNLERTLGVLRKEAGAPSPVVKPGQAIPIAITRTSSARSEGLGVPRLSQLYKAEVLNPFIGMKKWLPWRIRIREAVTGETVGVVAGSPWRSTYTGLKLSPSTMKKVKTAVDMLADRVRTIGRRDAAYTAFAKLLDKEARLGRKGFQEFVLAIAYKDFVRRFAKDVEAKVEARARRGEDYYTVFLEESAKAADAYIRLMSRELPGISRNRQLMEEFQSLARIEERVAYKPGRTQYRVARVDRMPDPGIAMLKYREVEVPSELEYALVYPDAYVKAYPRVKPPTRAELEIPTKPEPYKAFIPEPEPIPEPTPEPALVPVPEPMPEPTPEPTPEPIPEPEPEPTPEPVPEPIPEPKPKPPSEKPPIMLGIGRPPGERAPIIPAGSIAWAQGQRKGRGGVLVNQWYYIPPPFDQKKPISLSAPPIGALRAGSVGSYETIQVIGESRAPVPRRVDVDLGWADIFIINGREIHYKSGGEETDAGSRIPSPTTGMDLGRGGVILERGDIVEMFPKPRRRSKPKTTKRKARRKDDFSDLTTMKGMNLFY